MVNAVIFDLDGLLVDSTPLQQQAFLTFLESFDKLVLSLPKGREGMRIIDIIREYKDLYDLPGTLDELYAKRQAIFFDLARQHLQLFDGALPLLAKIAARNIKMALATSGDLDYVHLIFAKFPRLKEYLTTIITSEDVLRGKPYPDVYLKAAKVLQIEPATCVVLEDSVNGIVAAKAAGMQVICVPNKNYPEADYSRADKIFGTLEEVEEAIK